MDLTRVELVRIHPDPDNIRDNAEDADIGALAADIKSHGLLQPLVVYPDGQGDYTISGGHRRRLALLQLGHTFADVHIRDVPADDLERLDLMGSENLQRRQLNPIEEARFYKRYLDAGMTQPEVAARVGRTQSHISTLLGLLILSADMQRRIAAGELSVTAAHKAVKQARNASGVGRADYGKPHNRGFSAPYFTTAHPLHSNAASRCRTAEHDPALRLTGACGTCWERVIRLDAGAHPVMTNEPAPREQRRPVERFSDPREILRRLLCTRCRVPAIDRESRHCFAVREGKRVGFENHEFLVEVTPSLTLVRA